MSRSSLRSFSTFSSLLLSCWISSCNTAASDEGGGRRRGKGLAGTMLCTPSPPPARGGPGGGSPGLGGAGGAGALPCQGLGRDFPQPALAPPANSNPINGAETPGGHAKPASGREGGPCTPPGKGVGANKAALLLLPLHPKGLGHPAQARREGILGGCPTSTGLRARAACQLRAHRSLPSPGASRQAGGTGGDLRAPTPGTRPRQVEVKAEPAVAPCQAGGARCLVARAARRPPHTVPGFASILHAL